MDYSIIIHTPKGEHEIPLDAASLSLGEISVTVEKRNVSGMITLYSVRAEGKGKCYISAYGKGNAKFSSFNDFCLEEHVFRQSPHDPYEFRFAIDGSPVPMATAVYEAGTDIIISDEPSYCDNYTTQHIIPERCEFYVSSGDPGGAPNYVKWREDTREPKNEPYFHDLSDCAHTFRFIMVRSNSKTIKSIRRDAFLAIETTWGKNSGSIYRAMCFGANYMHLRKNETGTSEKWVVAGIQYANTQYQRDSFWQTWILSPEDERQCYLAHEPAGVCRAENPLFFVIWSYRIFSKGGEILKEVCDVAVNKMLECFDKVGDGRYCPDGDENHAFRNWFDICCFEDDDADAYSQGLSICALRAAREMGYDIKDRYEKAISFYKSMFNGEFIPLSVKKQYLALDYSIGDLLHFVLFGETFIPDDQVKATYSHIMNSKARTPFGTKIVSAADGEFLPMEAFGAYGKVHPEMARLDLGRYANGGSYHIYEMLFHIAAYVHGAEGALDNMIWRLFVDLDYDGATHEYMHTIKGNGVKANQGWNAAIYAIWEILCARGDADPRFFEAAEKKLRTIE